MQEETGKAAATQDKSINISKGELRNGRNHEWGSVSMSHEMAFSSDFFLKMICANAALRNFTQLTGHKVSS